MARALDPVVAETLKKYGFGKEAIWDCHGVWVVYHRSLEQIAAKAGITFDQPHVVEARGDQGIAAVCVTGRMGDKAVWSIGEASPKNNKNAYCWAMAEKRAIDRVILKLIGIHGLVYSEEEADDFKAQPTGAKPNINEWNGPLTKTDLVKAIRKFKSELLRCESIAAVQGCTESYAAEIEQLQIDMPDLWDGEPDGNGFVPLRVSIEEQKGLVSGPANMMRAG